MLSLLGKKPDLWLKDNDFVTCKQSIWLLSNEESFIDFRQEAIDFQM